MDMRGRAAPPQATQTAIIRRLQTKRPLAFAPGRRRPRGSPIITAPSRPVPPPPWQRQAAKTYDPEGENRKSANRRSTPATGDRRGHPGHAPATWRPVRSARHWSCYRAAGSCGGFSCFPSLRSGFLDSFVPAGVPGPGAAMPEAGNYGYKKTDGICDGVCGERASKAVLTMSRLKCALRGFDFRALLVLLIGVPIIILMIYAHGQKVTYFLRPIWESPPKSFKTIPHYYHENVTMDNLCKLHGWKVRDTPRRVFDAVLFSNELDILEIRWNELSPYVSEFVLLESNSTFTGLKKPLHFKENRHRFGFAESRLTYGMIGGRFVKGENPFVEESYQRVALDQLIKIAKIEDDDLLIMSDVDEIPSGHTTDLLRWCDDIPEILHLQLRNYLYSFEFFLDDKSWRASMHRYRGGKTRYAHFRQTDELLADSGWHCSFCFRYISDFAFKMQAYSHVDRIRFKYFLNPERIQDVICRGSDLFDMLPEEYTFQEIIAKLGNIPSTYSAVHLPSYLLKNVDRFRYLLPGNCRRESG